jgi:uncharacterized protein (TIGR03086 family)
MRRGGARAAALLPVHARAAGTVRVIHLLIPKGYPVTPVPLDDLAVALGAVGDLVAAVRPGQWRDPTPCREWNVRELVNHLVMGNRLFTGVLRGEAVTSPGALDPKTTDALGADPVAAYTGAARALTAAFGRPGALERVVVVPFGAVPGIVAVHLRITEALVHGWDLARATGQQPRLPGDIVERNLEFTRGALPDVPAGRMPFAPPQPVSDTAPAIVRLTALLGRSPAGPAEHGGVAGVEDPEPG